MPGEVIMAGARDSRNFRKQRGIFRAECEAEDRPCHLCGQAIDYSAPQHHPDSFELDHFFTVADRPDLVEDPANFRASHMACNRHRGNSAAVYALGAPSRQWFPLAAGSGGG